MCLTIINDKKNQKKIKNSTFSPLFRASRRKIQLNLNPGWVFDTFGWIGVSQRYINALFSFEANKLSQVEQDRAAEDVLFSFPESSVTGRRGGRLMGQNVDSVNVT